MLSFKKNKLLFAVLTVVSLLSLSAHSSAAEKEAVSTMFETGWNKRCAGEKEQTNCEAFQLLQVKQTKDRVAEFAVGFPAKGKARGAVVLPLGIMLENGVLMKVDDGKSFLFKMHYCTTGGCSALVNISDDLLSQLKEGKQVHFLFQSNAGQKIDLAMTLNGFGKVLNSIEK